MAAKLRNRRIAGYDYGGELGIMAAAGASACSASQVEARSGELYFACYSWIFCALLRRWPHKFLLRSAVQSMNHARSLPLLMLFSLQYRQHLDFLILLFPRKLTTSNVYCSPGDAFAYFQDVHIYVGLLCVAINTVIFLYLAIRLRHVIKTDASCDIIAPGAIPTATDSGVCVCIVASLGVIDTSLLITLFMSFAIISPYLPPYTKNNVDSQISDDPKCLDKNHD